MFRLLIPLAVYSFATTTRFYTLLPSYAFHNELKLAAREKRDGMIIAFLNDKSPNHATELDTYNRAAKSWRCLPLGGVRVFLTGEDDRAQFIADDLQELHSMPADAVPPIAVYFKEEKPVAWLAANGSSWPGAVGAIGSGGDYGASNLPYFFSTKMLEEWGHTVHGVSYVRSAADVAELHTRSERIVVGFYADSCAGEGLVFHGALAAHRKRHGAALPAAVSTNLTLGAELCEGLGKGGGVCAMLGHGKGARLTLPQHIPHAAEDVQEWLAGLVGGGASKEEL